MLALLKLIQFHHQDAALGGTPGQVAAGMVLGSAVGLTSRSICVTASVPTESTGRVQTEKQRLDEIEKQLKAELNG